MMHQMMRKYEMVRKHKMMRKYKIILQSSQIHGLSFITVLLLSFLLHVAWIVY